MPYPRKVPLITGETYHIFNKGIDGRIVFENDYDFERAVRIIRYYSFSSPPIKLSAFLDLNTDFQKELEERNWGEKLVSIICYCLMPNHFHFILTQMAEDGISTFISQFLNSYTRYFNTKNKRIGQLFLDRFKNVLVENDNQLIHLTRYIHLNPYSSGVIRTLDDLKKYKWSSFAEYLHEVEDLICDKKIVLLNFTTSDGYEKFVLERADYQKNLKQIQNQILE